MYEGAFIADGEGEARNKIYVYVMQRCSTYQLTLAQRFALFRVGNYGYSKPSREGEPTINGATVQYTDENGFTWYSEGGPQEGSTFTITEIGNDPLITSGKTFKANFNCRLYAWDGSSIQLTNGKFCGRIVSP